MKDIKCGLKTCKFNKGYGCTAKQISVSKNADCTTYVAKSGTRTSDFEAGTDFAKSNFSVDTAVGCQADCVFNKQGSCAAVGITVMSEDSSNAGCLTFLKK
ncbi:MAG: DUF1540 domain-containing protein [Clostridia bacterium]|nr:DUF1540 domain-containing protein [Clostridia bacterium]